MDTDIFVKIIDYEETGMLIMLFVLFTILLSWRLHTANRTSDKQIIRFLIHTSVWMTFLYAMDTLFEIPSILYLIEAHSCAFIALNLLVIPLCGITISLMTKRKNYSTPWLMKHFVPFILGLVIGWWLPASAVYVYIALALIYALVTAVQIFHAAIRYNKAAKEMYSSLSGRSFRWLLILPPMLTVLLLVYVAYLLTGRREWVLCVYEAISISIWITYFFSMYRMIVERIEESKNLDELDESMMNDTEQVAQETVVPSGEFALRLKQVCEDGELFLQDDLTREDLSRAMNTNHTYFTRQLQDEMGVNFYTYINGLRIERAKQLLIQHPDWPLEQIALESGYRNRTTFNNAFVRFAGKNPSDFRKNNK